MATAPAAATHLPLTTSGLFPHPHRRFASPYFPPASNNTSRSRSTRPSMSPPQQRENNGQTQQPSSFEFITTTHPKQFKEKNAMTKVRKQAMGHHLQTERQKSKVPDPSLAPSTAPSIASLPSTATQPDDVANSSNSSTTVSVHVPRTTRPIANPRRPSSKPTQSQHGIPTASSSAPSQAIMIPGLLIAPSREKLEDGRPLPYDAHPAPLLKSIGKAWDPFQTMFQASHPHVSVEQLKRDCSLHFGTKALGRYWIPMALDYAHTFLGSLCLATAYNDMVYNLPTESVQTIALRQEVIHLVGRNMTDRTKAVEDHNLMGVIQLIISEVIGREDMALKYHEDGIESMIRHRGGLNELGLQGRLAGSIVWVSLASSIMREERPRPMYTDYCFTHPPRQDAAVPESPIYCPRNNFQTLTAPEHCTTKALGLLTDIKMMIDMLLQEPKQASRNPEKVSNVYGRITNSRLYPSISEFKTTNKHEWRYEAIRITATILATAIMNKVPLSEALGLATKTLLPFFTSSTAGQTVDSPVSPSDTRRYSVAPDTASPSHYLFTNHAVPQPAPPYFERTLTHRSSNSSINSHRPSESSNATRPSISTNTTRPSFSSAASASSELLSFPAFAMPAALSRSVSQAVSLDTEKLLGDLREAIWKSDLSYCWENMANVLFWIGLTVGAATKDCKNKSLKRFFSAITMRAGIILCFDYPEAIDATALNMTRVVEALSSHTNSPLTTQRGPGKRQKAAK